ncbi:MAG: DNA repair protein RecN [Thermodesulfobacteriota bacterium]|nr:DNA repair protein RecN [Thermodesulfobacteriota bacterium]
MLRELKISNLALIEELHLDFSEGLIVLTGETGAGKSIVLQAIHLLSGGKASATWVRSGAEQAIIEALFEIGPSHSQLLNLLREKGFDSDGEIIIKRILSAKGRSRFYLNGSLSTARLISELCENLLNVASQHDHQQLLVPGFQLDFLDSVAELKNRREQFTDLYDDWQVKKKKFEELRTQEMDKEQRRDFLNFQCQEISQAKLTPGEDLKLVEEKDRLKSSDELNRLGRKSYSLLQDAAGNNLSLLRKNMDQMAALDQSIADLSEDVAGYCYQLEDQLAGLRDYLDSIPNNPARLDEICARIDLLQQLKRKYGPHLDNVIRYGKKAKEELAELDALEHNLDRLATELAESEQQLLLKAAELSEQRKKHGREITKKIINELHFLALDQAVFEIFFHEPGKDKLARMTRKGIDRPEFLFSANPGEPPKPVAKVASGGELSRLMLALKCLLASKDQVESVIFDEIDAGISGKAAEAVAKKIKELAAHHQVLCITHLPQIASYAEEHFLVAKSVHDQRTRSTISRLQPDEQVHELGRMLDGDSVTEKTLAYAGELLRRHRNNG